MKLSEGKKQAYERQKEDKSSAVERQNCIYIGDSDHLSDWKNDSTLRD